MTLQTTAVARQWLSSDHRSSQKTRAQQRHCNKGMEFYTQSVPRCYKQGWLAVAVSQVVFSVDTLCKDWNDGGLLQKICGHEPQGAWCQEWR
jgi:hypothetical protein